MFTANMNIKDYDPVLWQAIQDENRRQEEHIELIASENYASPRVMEAQGSQFTNKYAEGYPGKRYYGGCEYADIVEQLAIRCRLCECTTALWFTSERCRLRCIDQRRRYHFRYGSSPRRSLNARCQSKLLWQNLQLCALRYYCRWRDQLRRCSPKSIRVQTQNDRSRFLCLLTSRRLGENA